MGQPVTTTELQWLRDLDRLLRSGLTRDQAAMQLRVSNQTISNRLARLGLRIVWEPRLGSRATGKELDALLVSGELVLAERGPSPSRGWRPLQRVLELVRVRE